MSRSRSSNSREAGRGIPREDRWHERSRCVCFRARGDSEQLSSNAGFSDPLILAEFLDLNCKSRCYKMSTSVQVEELLVLHSIFGEQFWCTDPVFQSIFECDDIAVQVTREPCTCEFRVLLTPEGHALELSGQLPPEFPEKPPKLTVVSSLLSRSSQCTLQETLSRVCEASCGETGGLFDAVTAAEELAADALRQELPQLLPEPTLDAPTAELGIRRVFFWTHHTRKKQHLIYDWAPELCLSGRLTVSKPGYMLIEGPIEQMHEFVRRNMAQSWKQIKITWDESVTGSNIQELRLFEDGLREVSVDEFIAEFRRLGLDELLLEGTRGVVQRKS